MKRNVMTIAAAAALFAGAANAADPAVDQQIDVSANLAAAVANGLSEASETITATAEARTAASYFPVESNAPELLSEPGEREVVALAAR